MKAVILAGGHGTRLSEETSLKPKPMLEIGGKPILWHIMKHYSHHGINEFVVCLGYKGYLIKEYFANYFRHTSDFTIDLATNDEEYHNTRSENWKVTLVNTGLNTMTGGRIKRIEPYVRNEENFCMTYGDGVSDVNISKLISFHKEHGKQASLVAIQPAGRFGAIEMNGPKVTRFTEKPETGAGFINGGFFVLSPKVIEHIDGDESIWERKPMETLAANKQMMAYTHDGFWQCMDTLRDKQLLERLWDSGEAPWRVW